MSSTTDIFAAAVKQYRAGRLQEARLTAMPLIDRKETAGQASQLLGLIALKEGLADEAASCFTRALVTMGENPGLLLNLATALRQAAKVETAIEYLRTATRLAPERADIWFNLGNAEAELGRQDAAMAAFDAALAIDPRNIAAAWNAANLRHRNTGDAEYDAKVAAYLRVVAIDPHHAGAHRNIARLLRERGDLQTAISHFRQAVSAAPDNADDIAALANAVAEDGNLEEAEMLYRKAASKGDSAGILSNLAWVLLERGQPNQALAAAEQALHSDATLVGGHYHRALILLELDRPDAALDAVAAALKLSSRHVRSHALQGLILERLGRHESVTTLFNYDRYIGQYALPDGRDLLAGLAKAVRADPSLLMDRPNRATRGGSQTLALATDATSVFAQLRTHILSFMQDYLAKLSESDHPFFTEPIQVSPDRLVMWGVVLETAGYQNPHNHPSGVLSGVCYIDVPAEIQSGAEDGWIEFGASNVRDASGRFVLGQHRKRFQPVPGKLLIFPSHFWHRTIPYRYQGQRISIAFDLLPPHPSHRGS